MKFQTFITEENITKNAEKAEYQKKITDKSESQFEMIKKLELDRIAHEELIQQGGHYARLYHLQTTFS